MDPAQPNVNARIVYWGAQGAGKSANLRMIHAKLRADHRGELREVPTRIDPSVCYEVLPIELGEIAGVRTRIQIIAPPGGPEHAPTRKQLLDKVDAVVFVVDAQRDRIDDNVAAFDELRRCLAAYGRALESVPLVIQYNKRDLADPYALEELHRKLDVRGAGAFEAVATDGTGVLQTLTTISKRVIRARRETPETAGPAPEAQAPAPAVRIAMPASPMAPAAAALPQVAAPRPAPRSVPSAPAVPSRPIVSPPLRGGVPVVPNQPQAARYEPGPREAGSATVELDAREIARATTRTQAELDEAWPEVTGRLHAEAMSEAAAPGNALRIATVGRAELVGPRSVRLPLVLEDGAGRRQSLCLTLSLEPLLDAALDDGA
jgi:hypothetical protein